MSTLFQPGQHPNADQLNAFVDHALPPHEREQTLAHLATCPHCRGIVALSMPPSEEALPQPKPVGTPWFSGWKLAWAAAATTAALFAMIALTLHPRKAQEDVASVHPPAIPERAPEPPAAKAPEPAKPAPKPAPAKPRVLEQPAPGISTQGINGLPVENRDSAPLPQASPATAAARNGFGAGITSGPPPPSFAARSSGAVMAGPLAIAPGTAQDSDSASIQPAAGLSTSMPLHQVGRAIRFGSLPSNLPIVSTAAHGEQVLALDTQNTLFRSDDSGQHWQPVSAPWKSRVLRVDLTASVTLRNPVAATALAPLSYAAPSGTSSLSGTLSDASGAIISGATVTLLSPQARTTQTDTSGHYLFSDLPAGSYTLQASAPGFMSSTSTVPVPAAHQTTADQILTVGSVSETVTVSAANSSIDLIATPSEASAAPAPKIAAPRTATLKIAAPIFDLTTESGEHWVSPDGQTWTRR
jgi:hypothetical protein